MGPGIGDGLSVVYLINQNIDWGFLAYTEYFVSCNALWTLVTGRNVPLFSKVITAKAVQGDC